MTAQRVRPVPFPLCPTPTDAFPVARTPSKLTTMLLQKGVPESAIETHLTISQGDVLNPESCADPLTLKGRPADIIISGIGIVNLSEIFSPIRLCGDAVSNILSALHSLKLPKKPLFVALATTGISKGPRDVPLLFVPLYHLMLANPHKDKKRMEDVVVERAEREDSAIGGYVLLRPSLLTNGKARGGKYVRAGNEQKPAVGYTISRDDVGLWIFENLVQGDGQRFAGQKPSITY